MSRSLALGLVKSAAAAADAVRPRRRGAVLLAYHRVGGRSGREVDVPLQLFTRQVEALAAGEQSTTLDSALALLGSMQPPAIDPVVVTFDDGTADFADTAVPVLVRHEVPATLYLATGLVDGTLPVPDGGTRLSWAALRDVLSTGLVTVGSHTHTHAVLGRLDVAAVERELERSVTIIEDHLGTAVEHFAYPKAVLAGPAGERAVRRRFRSAALSGIRPNPYGRTDPHRLSRSPIQVSDGMRWFARKAAGGMALEGTLRTMLDRRRYSRAAR